MRKYFRYRFSKPKKNRRSLCLNEGETQIEVYAMSDIVSLLTEFHPKLHEFEVVPLPPKEDIRRGDEWAVKSLLYAKKGRKRLFVGICNFNENSV